MGKRRLLDTVMEWFGWVRVEAWGSALRCIEDRDRRIDIMRRYAAIGAGCSLKEIDRFVQDCREMDMENELA